MGKEAPRPRSLCRAKQELERLAAEYPTGGKARTRVRYFAAAVRRGMKIHAAYGSDKPELFGKIGLSVGVSAELLETWTKPTSRVHRDFHFAVLMCQASLMNEHVFACTKVMEHLRLHLNADDWRGELGAFVHLRKIGLKALIRYGGAGTVELIEELRAVEEDEPADTPIESRRLILTLMADALQEAIGTPEERYGEEIGTELTGARPELLN